MRLKPLEVLSREELSSIHNASLSLMWNVGFKIRSEKALRLLSDAGATVDFEKKHVQVPESLVREALKNAPSPSRIVLYDRKKKPSLKFADERTYTISGFDCPFVVDTKSGDRRPITVEDIGKFARLADALENIHIVGNQGIAQDVHPSSAEIIDTEAIFKNTSKHVFLSPSTPEVAKTIIEMAKVISGEEDLSKAPIITLENSPTSPLAWGANAVESLIETATNGILFNVLPSPMSGTTSPITLAGTLQILNAEVLSAILIAQLARKGTPVMYGSAANITDMREANPVACTPEAAILDIACIQLGKYYNLPTNTVGADSDSHCLDEQAAWEILLTGTAAICAGANTMLNVGMISNGMQVSYEQLVIDNEILGLLFRFCNGIELSHETLATDLIKKVGPEGHFLAEANFAMRYLDKEYWTPILSCRSTYGKWAKQGRKDVVERAKENTQKILNEHKAEELPKNVENELRQIVRRFEKRVITQT